MHKTTAIIVSVLASLFLLLLSGPVANTHAGVLGAKDYNECLLENIKGASNTLAMREVKKTCARKFPKTVPLDDVDLIVYVMNSGELMLNIHYKAVHRKFYSDLEYEEYLKGIFEKLIKETKYQDISFEEFLSRIEYKKKE